MLETKVLERLRNQASDRNIKIACKEFSVDPYDFKDRWGPMLRTHSPTEILEDIAAIRPRLHEPPVDVAKDLGLPVGTIRTIAKKLLVTPESDHQRTKENLAHRLIARSGGSLREAKAQLGSIPRTVPKKDNNDGEESSSSSSDSEKPTDNVKVEKVTTVPAERRPAPPPRPAKSSRPIWYEQTMALLSGTEERSISPEAQLRILEDIHRGTDTQKACQKLGIDMSAFKSLWGPFLRLIEPSILDASIYMIVVLSRLGYAVCKLAEVLAVTKHYVHSVLSNLGLELGPSDSISFDVSILLVGKEQLTATRIAEICKVPGELGRAIVKRAGQREQFVAKVNDAFIDAEKAEAFLWLYERGLPLSLICTAKQIAQGMMKVLLPEDD